METKATEAEQPWTAPGIFADPIQPQTARGEDDDKVTISTAPSVLSYDELRPEEKNRTTLRKKQLPMREGLEDESFFTIWTETNDSRTQDEIAIEAFRVAIEAAKKVDQTAMFRCIYKGDGDRRLNEETGKMEPYPDITCAADMPEDIAGLRKYFEPSFDAMLIDQKGDDDDMGTGPYLEHHRDRLGQNVNRNQILVQPS